MPLPTYRRVTVIGMDEFEPPSTGQALSSATEIIDGPLIEVVQLALRSPAPHECGDRLDQETKLHLGALQGVDIRQEHVPTDNVPARITKRKPTNLKPVVDAIETPDACLEVVWLA